MVNRVLIIVCILCGSLLSTATLLQAETAPELKNEIDALVLQHYFGGIDYEQAHALGPDAVPYLVELLSNPEKKEYWVNIIVTLGFVEDPEALNPLINFLEQAQGEVDINTFRALLSIHYAIGCISSTGDIESLNYLSVGIDTPNKKSVAWSYHNKDAQELLWERALLGMAVSGRPDAKEKLHQVQQTQQTKTVGVVLPAAVQRTRADILDTAFSLMSRIEKEGRSSILNPETNR